MPVAQVTLYMQVGFTAADIGKLANSKRETFCLGVPMVKSKFKFLREEVRLCKFVALWMLHPMSHRVEIYEGMAAATSRSLMAARMLCNANEPRCVRSIPMAQLGMDNDTVRRMVLKFPRILEYRTEHTIRPRLNFLKKCGIADADLCKVMMRSPQTMGLSVDDTLEPRVAFLRNEVRE